jgi:hypothetical protein
MQTPRNKRVKLNQDLDFKVSNFPTQLFAPKLRVVVSLIVALELTG